MSYMLPVTDDAGGSLTRNLRQKTSSAIRQGSYGLLKRSLCCPTEMAHPSKWRSRAAPSWNQG